ncbi:MAG: low specificity L-threonine aldolase [Ruminococcaceae bacterium]|nr:low specificity L-threonine aldolase [Oscillospiraceae bacterium]
MIRFDCDYTEGAHPNIIAALSESNFEQTCGYGEDHHCENARAYIKKAIGCESADVHFLVGGTQANMTVIASILRPYQGVLCAESGHINCHETGAVEATGHKVLALSHKDGKICAKQVRDYVATHWRDAAHEHIVQPGMVYISQPTEYGTLYSREELKELYAACRELELPLFVDGARLGYALAADKSFTLPFLAANCDVFYIGGTKVGCLFGEAVCITNDALKRDFRYMIKRMGGMLAKGRLLGIQFEEMFRDGLYFRVAEKAVANALRIKAALIQKGIPLLMDSATNQQFPILTKAQQATLGEKYALGFWDTTGGERDAIRICTSWASSDENVDALIADIMAL